MVKLSASQEKLQAKLNRLYKRRRKTAKRLGSYFDNEVSLLESIRKRRKRFV